MGCWFRKGCVSVGVWPVGVFALRRPGTTGAPTVVMVGFGSVFDCVMWGFMNWARGSNPELNSWDESRDGTGTWTGGGGTYGGLDWTTWGGIWGWGATGPAPLLRGWWGLLVSLLDKVFFCCLGTSPDRQTVYEIHGRNTRKADVIKNYSYVSQNKTCWQLLCVNVTILRVFTIRGVAAVWRWGSCLHLCHICCFQRLLCCDKTHKQHSESDGLTASVSHV